MQDREFPPRLVVLGPGARRLSLYYTLAFDCSSCEGGAPNTIGRQDTTMYYLGTKPCTFQASEGVGIHNRTYSISRRTYPGSYGN